MQSEVLADSDEQHSLLRADSADAAVAFFCSDFKRTTQHVQAVGIISECTDLKANDSNSLGRTLSCISA